MKVVVSGVLEVDGETVTIAVECDQEVYENKVADAYVRARKEILKKEEQN